MIRHAPRATLCAYTTLFRSLGPARLGRLSGGVAGPPGRRPRDAGGGARRRGALAGPPPAHLGPPPPGAARPRADRKSTRLNSSHANISYAVFCLKKKKRALL